MTNAEWKMCLSNMFNTWERELSFDNNLTTICGTHTPVCHAVSQQKTKTPQHFSGHSS